MNQTSKILIGVAGTGVLAFTGVLLFRNRGNKTFGDLPFVNIYGNNEFLKDEVRGVRNNNPGNIRLSNSNWKGKVPNNKNIDGVFEQFVTYPYGIRALLMILRTYYYTHKLRTLNDIINRYAPTSENDTKKYINAVASQLNIEPNQQFELNRAILIALVYTIDRIENGKRTILANHLKEALSL